MILSEYSGQLLAATYDQNLIRCDGIQEKTADNGILIDGFLIKDGGISIVAMTMAAAGNSQGTATTVVTQYRNIIRVTDADGTKGILLPSGIGQDGSTELVIFNDSASILKVYPATGETINGAAANAAYEQAGNSIVRYIAPVETAWQTIAYSSNVEVTATTGGGTTGLIPAFCDFVTVISDNADKQISLPAAVVGKRIRILVGATGCELISAVASHKVNDVVVGATNEAALVATSLYDCQYVATDTWVVIGYTKLGAVEAALVPDAL